MPTNGWKPRQIESVLCPSGQKVSVRRPGPEFTLRAGKVARTFSEVLKKKIEDVNDSRSEEERGMDVVASLSDEERNAVLMFAKELICAIVVSPRIVMNPQAGEAGPDDIGDDLWFLFNYAMKGFYNVGVSVAQEEVEVKDLETFRPESGISGDSLDSTPVRTDSVEPNGDSGLVAGA